MNRKEIKQLIFGIVLIAASIVLLWILTYDPIEF